jgi:hypothetical protein
MIIGLTGHYGSGKDAAGAVLVARGFRRLAFADLVREEVELQKWPACMPWRLRLRFAFDWLWGLDGADLAEEIWAKPTTPRMRKLLQWWGTEYRRAEDHHYWVRRLGNVLASDKSGNDYVITDVRFEDEAFLIRQHWGEVWRITRPGCEGDAHESERGIDHICPDLVIANDGTLEELKERVLLLINQAQITQRNT